VSPATQLESETLLSEARIQLFNAQQTLINLGLPVRIEDMTKLSSEDLAQRMRTLGLETIMSSADEKKMDLDNLIPLKAPFDGEIVGRDIVQGEIVGPNKPVQFTVADLRRMSILSDVREEDKDLVRLDQEVSFQVDGSTGEPVTGLVSWISREMDEKTRTLRVRTDVQNPDRKLLVHSFGIGRILVRSIPSALAVPDSAIQARHQCHMVFVRLPDGKSFQTRLVKLGIHNDGYTQILDGLAAGEEVVTVGSHALKAEMLRNLIVGAE
jgi:cobalt-zinc-cadmium efflux system membrane fusion protein